MHDQPVSVCVRACVRTCAHVCVRVHSTNRTLQTVAEIGDTDACGQAYTSMFCTHACKHAHTCTHALLGSGHICVLKGAKHAAMPSRSICSAQKKSRANSTASCAEGTYRMAAQSALKKATVRTCTCTYEITVIWSLGACRCLPIAGRHFFDGPDVLKQPRLDQLVRNLTNILHIEHSM